MVVLQFQKIVRRKIPVIVVCDIKTVMIRVCLADSDIIFLVLIQVVCGSGEPLNGRQQQQEQPDGFSSVGAPGKQGK